MLLLAMAALLLQDAGDCFPLKPGMKWTYKTGEGTEVVKAVRQLPAPGDKPTFAISNFGAWGVFKEKEAHVRVAKDAIEVGRLSKYDVEILWLKSPLKAGERWISKLKLKDVQADLETVVVGEEEVEVPAGKYTCIKVKTVMKDGEGSAGEFTTWYAKGVGEVSSAFVLQEGAKKVEITRKLVKFETEAGK